MGLMFELLKNPRKPQLLRANKSSGRWSCHVQEPSILDFSTSSSLSLSKKKIGPLLQSIGWAEVSASVSASPLLGLLVDSCARLSQHSVRP